MDNYLAVSAQTSLKRTVLPFVLSHLVTDGYAMIRLEDSFAHEHDMLIISALIGQSLAAHMSYKILEAESERAVLPAHTEGISYSSGIIPYFGLGAITAPKEGGETRIFDARIAACKLLAEHPSLAGVTIAYESLANPGEHAKYPLVVESVHGKVLRYRGEVITNVICEAQGRTAKEIYQIVDHILSESVLLEHHWNVGDMLFVNNTMTLHDRLPFEGKRRMLRVRFGDQLNQKVHY